MKKVIITAFAICIGIAAANAAWNQKCFYGKCCVEGKIVAECACPVEKICHEKCAAVFDQGNAFIGCKQECSAKKGKYEPQKPAPKPQPAPAPKPAVKEEPKASIVTSSQTTKLAAGRTVRIEGNKYPFPSNSAAPSPELKKHITEKVQDLKGAKYNKVIITGYTDSTGAVDYNNQLSKQRAESVKAIFVENGVPAAKVETVGKGPQDPIATNQTAAGRKANRRVEITVQ
jgi:outer membrane protein OmpA-like peptidoglycan-associated protein